MIRKLSLWVTQEDREKCELDSRMFGVAYAQCWYNGSELMMQHIPAETVALLQHRWINELRDYAESG